MTGATREVMYSFVIGRADRTGPTAAYVGRINVTQSPFMHILTINQLLASDEADYNCYVESSTGANTDESTSFLRVGGEY